MYKRALPVLIGVSLILLMVPATVYAAASDLHIDIMPKECVIETVNDGTTQESFLTPKECDELLHPTPKPQPGGGQQGNGQGDQNNQDNNNGGNGQGGRIVRTTNVGNTGNQSASDQSDAEDKDDGISFVPDIAVLDAIASWLSGSKTRFVSAVPYAMSGVLIVTGLIIIDAVATHLVYTKWVVRKASRPAAKIRRLVRRGK
jgi:hypothetical protein